VLTGRNPGSADSRQRFTQARGIMSLGSYDSHKQAVAINNCGQLEQDEGNENIGQGTRTKKPYQMKNNHCFIFFCSAILAGCRKQLKRRKLHTF
jgi:hypothetical protein